MRNILALSLFSCSTNSLCSGVNGPTFAFSSNLMLKSEADNGVLSSCEMVAMKFVFAASNSLNEVMFLSTITLLSLTSIISRT